MSEIKNKKVSVKHLGLIDFKSALDYQTQLFESIVQQKIKNRNLEVVLQQLTENHLLFCEHPHVFTLGKSGAKANLLVNEENLLGHNASYFETNRGGDITYHGPGQVVCYPLLDLDNFFTDIHKYMRYLEEAVIRTLQDFGLDGGRIQGLTGVWLDHEKKINPRKICALGVKTSRWVTMHGLALNVNTDLNFFNYIVPCGISDKGVTSIEKETGQKIDLSLVENKLLGHLKELFEMEISWIKENTH